MVFDSLINRAGGKDKVSPMKIAHNSLLTAREKIDLLNQLKADVTGAQQEGDDTHVGFDAAEIDAAIEEVRLGVQNGVNSDTVIRGDY
ncbi:hypothetical protein [Devosia sp. RR2S18]|jgi:hypothetical protein|uniref:hypothetical protein n=1 Tax=Devosia rhizosphaerae TaxID=3049774 RepID=UPI002540FBF2|nr:hypothetical protein [Devosia sp. RR2S18]WIJ24736.1 hypothetical protein QOV41_17250 [Devosia sp. RR2S18]HEV7292405.1 hypothetical protein [Devosia sp.]